LCPTLESGDIVILDTLSSHTNIADRAVIRARGARLPSLPPRLQTHRACCCKAQTFAPNSRRASTRDNMARHRNLDECLLTARLRQRPRQHRIRVNIISSDFRPMA
jgi:hypothetical protein